MSSPETAPAPSPPRAGALPKVLYVGGFSRSGSTLVGRVLGEAPTAVCVGETRHLCARGLLNNVQCGCGEPFRSCSFWSAVGEEGFGGWEHVDAERLVAVDDLTSRLRALPFHWAPALRAGFAGALAEYVSWLTRLYGAIARVAGVELIVDMSKNPNFASLLRRIPGNDTRIVHLVRDSRAVAYSWTRSKRMPSPIGEQQYMPKFRPTGTAARWLVSNTGFHALAAGRAPYLRVAYEDFVAAPRDTLARISAFAQTELCPPASALDHNRVKLGDHHIFSGNPMRASTGWVEMRIDDEWQRELSPAQLAEVTAITWPLLRRYGYPTIPRSGR